MKHIILFTISCFISGISIAQVMQSETNITITQGATLYVDGNLNINAGEINLNQGATLSMGNNRTLSVNYGGSLKLTGSVTFPALVSSPGYFNLEVNSGGTIGAQHTIFEKLANNGVFIKPGANVDPSHPFDNSTFRNGITGGTLLTVNNDQVFTVNAAVFPSNNWGGSYNVTKTVNNGEVHFVDASGGFAGTPFENDPFARVFWGDELMTHSIPLPAGWSGLSSYVTPANNNIVSIFVPLGSNFIIAQTMTQAYYPAGGINTIVSWQPQSAYRIKMNAPDVLDISGEEEFNKVFGMNAGWSLVPVIANQPVNVASLFAGTSVQLVKDVAGVGVYWPAFGINTLGSLLPGKAYYAYLNSSGLVTFPANSKSAWTAQRPQIKHPDHPWDEVAITGSSHLIAIETDGMQQLQPGDLFGVFSQQQVCFGITEIYDPRNNALIAAYADDSFTGIKDGFDEMEPMTYRIFRPSTGEVFEVEVEYNQDLPHSGNFTGEGLSAIRMLKLSATGINNELVTGISIYPNPTTSIVTIGGITGIEQILIMSVEGAIVMTYNPKTEGNQVIDLSRLPAGIYQVQIRTSQGVVTRKVAKGQ